MNREERIDYWLSVADYDLETAEAMYSTGRWLYVAFMCHQVIEKTLKAYWCATKEQEPPYIHNLNRLADGAGLMAELSEEQCDFIEALTPMNIQARYPEYKDQLSRTLTTEYCQEIINGTKSFMQWIRNKLSI